MFNYFSGTDAKDLLTDSQALSDYQEGMDFFHKQLVYLNTNIYVIEKVVSFPDHLFMSDFTFLNLTITNAWQISLLTIHKLLNDETNNAFTMPRFMKSISQEWLKEEHKKNFYALLRQKKFNKNTRALLDRVKNIRHAGLAHFMKDDLDDPNFVKDSSINLQELKTLQGEIWKLLDTLSFNVSHTPFPTAYLMTSFNRRTNNVFTPYTDIEKILLNIAKESSAICWPEKYPELWQSRRGELTEEELNAFNTYRRELGLSEA